MIKILQAWYASHKLLCRILACLVIFYTLAGFAAAPLVVRHILESRVSAALHREVRAAAVRTNPFTFSLRLADLSVSGRDSDAAFVRIGRLDINTDPLISLFKRGVVIRSIHIHSPSVRITRTGDRQFNFSDLLAPSPVPSGEKTPPESKPVRLVMGELHLSSGEIRYADDTLDVPFETSVKSLDATVKGVDTRPDAGAFDYTLRGGTEAGENFEVSGRCDIHPVAVDARTTIENLAPAKYAPYYRRLANVRPSRGRVGIHARLQWNGQTRAVTGLKMTVDDLVLKSAKDQESLVRLPKLIVEDAGIDFRKRQVRLGRIQSQDARIFIQRDARGQLNLQTAFSPRPPSASAQPRTGEATDQGTRASSWKIELPELKLQGYAVDVEDLQPSPPVRTRLHDIALAAENLSTEPRKQGAVDLTLQWADQGTLSALGEVGLSPLQAGLDVTADKLDIRPLQSYAREYIKLVFTRGKFSARGRLQWVPEEDATDLRFAGQASLDDFEAVDTDKAALFAKWKSLFLTGIHIGTAPAKAQIEKIALTDFFNRLTINTDGTVNIETVLVRPPAAKNTGRTAAEEKRAGGSSGPSAAIGIKTITLQGGRVDYNDQYIKPAVHLVMEELGGIVSGLDNIKENTADVRLQGKVGGNVPLEVKGRINPLIEEPFVDLALNFPDFDLSPFTPYSEKYLGYTLDKGQLAFSLKYLVADNKLTGQNQIQLSQLTFGAPVASPLATKLPVKLAVALLKNREGNIELNLPVKGDLDDPQFSLGGVIVKMFVNLIRQIVSSPFKVLGGMFGGGEEIAYLAFDPGQSAISPSQAEKLNTLEKILFERPGLRLDIQGRIAPQADTDGLRRLRFEEQLKTDKLKALVAAGRKAVPLDRIALSPEERNAMIQKTFDAADLPKPRDENGRLKKLPPPEMEKLLLMSVDIGADNLRRLALDRASAAKARILAKGRIESGRLFIVEPQIPGDSAGQDAKPQVQFDFK